MITLRVLKKPCQDSHLLSVSNNAAKKLLLDRCVAVLFFGLILFVLSGCAVQFPGEKTFKPVVEERKEEKREAFPTFTYRP